MRERQPIRIVASIACADQLRIAGAVDVLARERIDGIHLDIADGQFAPTFLAGMPLADALSRGPLPVEAHLMAWEPERHIRALASVGVHAITVHAESTPRVIHALKLIKDVGLQPGIAFNLTTPLAALEATLELTDRVTIMAVDPGFSGQRFMAAALERVRCAASLIGERQIRLQVDGGVAWEVIPAIQQAGATEIVAGTSTLFGRDVDLAQAARRLRTLCRGDLAVDDSQGATLLPASRAAPAHSRSRGAI